MGGRNALRGGRRCLLLERLELAALHAHPLLALLTLPVRRGGGDGRVVMTVVTEEAVEEEMKKEKEAAAAEEEEEKAGLFSVARSSSVRRACG